MRKSIGKKLFSIALSAMAAFFSGATALTTVLSSSMLVVSAAQDNDTVSEIPADNRLPVVCINVDETAEGYGTIDEMHSSPDHSTECTGTIKIVLPEGYKGDYSEEILADTNELQLEYIRGRGNSSWESPKKSYKFKLDKKADLLGMGKNKHWNLIAYYSDRTLLKNRITDYIGTELGLDYTPQMLPVDLVMNGKYLGCYFLSEQIRVDKTRVDIDELTADDNIEPEITGGYLLSYGAYVPKNNETDIPRTIRTEKGEVFLCDSPEFYTNDADNEYGTDEQFSYISDYLQKVENAVYGENFRDENGVYIGDCMDLESAASYWWVNNFLKNYDGFKTDSTHLYKVRNGKLFWGPLWDFDQAMSGSFADFEMGNNDWLDRLRAYNTEYQQILFEKWDRLDAIITEVVKEGGVIDRYVSEIYNSEEDDAAIWHPDDADYNEAVENLRSWLKNRQQWVRENVRDKLTKVFCSVTFIDQGKIIESIEQRYMKPVLSVPTPSIKDGYVFIKWEIEDDKSESILSAVTEDVMLTARYIPEEEARLSDYLFLSSYDVWYDLRNSGEGYTPFVQIFPDDADETVFKWTSSDPSVADVGAGGTITPYSVGNTVITVGLKNGRQKTMNFHVYDSQATPMAEADSLMCENDTISVKVGEYAQVIASSSPQPNSSDFLLFDCDNENVIELLDDGVFRALAPGEAVVTVSDFNGLTAVCKVIVTESDKPPQDEPSQSESSQSKPPQDEPSQSEPSQSEPPQDEPSQSEPSQSEPSQDEPSQSEPSQSEPSQDEHEQSGFEPSSDVTEPIEKPVRTGSSNAAAAVLITLLLTSGCAVICLYIRRKSL